MRLGQTPNPDQLEAFYRSLKQLRLPLPKTESNLRGILWFLFQQLRYAAFLVKYSELSDEVQLTILMAYRFRLQQVIRWASDTGNHQLFEIIEMLEHWEADDLIFTGDPLTGFIAEDMLQRRYRELRDQYYSPEFREDAGQALVGL